MGGFSRVGPKRNNANNAEAKRYRDNIDARRCVIHYNMNNQNTFVATSLVRHLRSSAVKATWYDREIQLWRQNRVFAGNRYAWAQKRVHTKAK